ncbi:Gag-protease polyprotein [Thalictrum thalictroides]|uniref:Gag-protease polyprotein n=1 Tax=Thalictrum thalictroides TaxID=46969 RepID=A0A7J6VRX1_THATH|nr:Gag-protease polyprotein [Thalictrum thalictroides]
MKTSRMDAIGGNRAHPGVKQAGQAGSWLTLESTDVKLGSVLHKDCTNSIWGLGQQVDDSVIVRKILRSLPVMFDPKVTAIEESKNVGKLDLKELVGSIQTFEMKIAPRTTKQDKPIPEKSIAFKSSTSDEKNEDLVLMVKRMGSMYRKSKNFVRNQSTSYNTTDKSTPRFDRKKSRGSDDKKCDTCGGTGHISTVCPKDEGSSSKKVFVAISESKPMISGEDDGDSDSEGDSEDDELQLAYNELYEKFKKAAKRLESNKTEINDLSENCKLLQAEKDGLVDQVTDLKSSL